MQADGELRLSPPWKHALQVLIEQGLKNGDVIRKEALVELLGLRAPITAEDQVRFQLDFMQQFTDLREELLEEHRIALRTMYGESSYEVVPPSAQTELAVSDGMKEIRRSIRKTARMLAFVRHEELTDEQRKQNADAQAKTAMLASMVRQTKLIG